MRISFKNENLLAWLCLVFIVLATAAIYSSVGSFSWILGSDQELLIENTIVHQLTGNKIFDIFLSTTAGRYEPLAVLSYAVDIAVWPSGVRGVHMMNLILHLLNVIVFFRLVQVLSRSVRVAVVAATLFALHPANAEAVAWISARSQLLGTFLLLLALLSYAYYADYSYLKKRYFRMSVFFFVAGLFSNPLLIIFPLAAIILDMMKGRDIGSAIKEKYAVAALSLIWFIIMLIISMNATTEGHELLPGILPGIVYYVYASALLLIRFVVPVGYVAFHPFPDDVSLVIVVVVVILMLAVAALWRWRKKFKQAFAAILYFLLTYMLIYIFSPGTAMVHDSHAYAPYLSLFLLSGLFFKYLLDELSSYKYSAVIISFLLTVFVILLALTSYERKNTYKDSGRLWTEVIGAYPDHHRAFFMRGDYWAMNGAYEKAKFDYQQSLKRNPHAFMAMNNLGLIYMEEGDLRLALKEFNRAIEQNDRFYKAFLNKGIILMRLGTFDQALDAMNRAASLAPGQALVFYNRGLLKERLNALPEAIEDFTTAIRLDPYRLIFYKDRGKAYGWMNNFSFAERDYSKAIDLDPGNAELWFRRSLARTSQDNFKGGLEDALMAKKLGFPVEEDYIKGLARQVVEKDLPEANQEK